MDAGTSSRASDRSICFATALASRRTPSRIRSIGMFEESIYQEETVTLEPGDRLYFYTDGVIEATDAAQVELGSARLMAELDRVRVLPLKSGLEAVAETVCDWSGGGLEDDVSLLAIERVVARSGVAVA